MTANAKRARLLAGLTVPALAACAGHTEVQAPPPAPQELVLWRIEQRGYGPLASFEFCEARSCATPSKKSVAVRARARTSEAGDAGAGEITHSSTPNASSGPAPRAVTERPP